MKNWKMKCINNKDTERLYTIGKVYEVKNNIFVNDNGVSVFLESLERWQGFSRAEWQLVEDNVHLFLIVIMVQLDNGNIAYSNEVIKKKYAYECYTELAAREESNVVLNIIDLGVCENG